jgi:hypothetical protein
MRFFLLVRDVENAIKGNRAAIKAKTKSQYIVILLIWGA